MGLSGTGPVAGWVNTKVFDETGDAQKAQGWAPFVLDTNGNGKLDEYAEPNQPADPSKDMRITAGSGPYAVMPNPTDGSIWYTVGVFGGRAGLPALRSEDQAVGDLLRAEARLRHPRRRHRRQRRGLGLGLERPSRSSFDRRKCKGPLNGPNGDRRSLPGGLDASTSIPGPGFDGFADTSAEASYYTWVDQHNTLGLGEDVPISTANLNDGFVALKDGKMVVLRMPYPMGFYAKGLDGRIDDPNAGWKGRGLWSDERRPHAVAERERQGQPPAGRAHPGAARTRSQTSITVALSF